MRKIHITRLVTAASLAGAFTIASAFASDAKNAPSAPATITSPDKLPQFANVVVVNATPAQLAALSAERMQTNAGMRAYVDPVTKTLRAGTPDDFAAEAAAAPAAKSLAATKNVAKRSAALSVEANSVGTTAADGTVSVMLDESYMSYSVATVKPDGTVKQDCVEGQPNSKAALKSVTAAQGASNEK